VVEIFAFLELEQKLPFFKGLKSIGEPGEWSKDNNFFAAMDDVPYTTLHLMHIRNGRVLGFPNTAILAPK
jgi:hypothetical protein